MLYQSLKSKLVVVCYGKILFKWGAEKGNKFTRTEQRSCTSTYRLTSQTALKKHHISNLKKKFLEFIASLNKVGESYWLGEIYPDAETKSSQQTMIINSQNELLTCQQIRANAVILPIMSHQWVAIQQFLVRGFSAQTSHTQ